MQSEKLALVGRLAAGMAHSSRNPMTSIKIRQERMVMAKILIIDDDDQLRISFSKLLTEEHYDVVSAASREAGIEVTCPFPSRPKFCTIELLPLRDRIEDIKRQPLPGRTTFGHIPPHAACQN